MANFYAENRRTLVHSGILRVRGNISNLHSSYLNWITFNRKTNMQRYFWKRVATFFAILYVTP